MRNSNRKLASTWLNTASFLMATSCLTPVGAFAACLPSPAQSGDTVVCTGTDTAGVGSGVEDNVKLTVTKGASIVDSGDGYAVQLGKNSQVINNGAISDTGLFVWSFSNVHNTASGTIAGVIDGVVAIESEVLNDGGITSDGTAVRLGDSKLVNGGTITSIAAPADRAVALDTTNSTLQNNGVIYAEGPGFDAVLAIWASGINSLTNDGLIHANATDDDGSAIGVWAPSGGQTDITNNDTFKVSANGGSTGFDLINGKVVNNGDLVVDGGNGATGIITTYVLDLNNSGSISVTSEKSQAAAIISGGGSTVVNSGEIIASGPGGAVGITGGFNTSGSLHVTNSGVIDADVAITVRKGDSSATPVDISNSGVIIGDILLGDAGDTLFNHSGGKISGAINTGDNADTVINAGLIDGVVDLGAGNDFFFGTSGGIGGGDGLVTGGDGFDTVGFYATGKASGMLEVVGDFEAAGVFVEDGAEFTILPSKSGDTFVRLYGEGKVVNGAALSSFSKDHPTVEMLGEGLEFENQGDIKGNVGVALSGNGQTFTNNADITRDFIITDNTGNGAFIEDRGLGNTIINNATIESNGFSTEGVMIGGDELLAATLTYVAVGDLVENLQPVPTSTLINNGTISGGTKFIAGGGVITGSFAPVDIINNGDISRIDSYVRRGGVSIQNAKDATIGDSDIYAGALANLAGIEVVLETTTTDEDRFEHVQKFKPSTFNTGVEIVNETGATIDHGIHVSGVVSTTWLGYFGKNVNFSIDIENEAGGTILANNAGNAIAIQPLVIKGEFVDTVKFETVIHNSGFIGGAIIGGDLAETIVNRGSIEGTISLGAADDTIELLDGASIKGNVQGGTGVDTITSADTNQIVGDVTEIENLILLDGELTVTGNYTQTASGAMSVELKDGSNSRLVVSGNAALDGILATGLAARDLSTLEGKAYSVLTAGSITGEFDTTGAFQQGFWTLNVQQSGTAVTVTITDVNLTIGATAPMTLNLAHAIAAAAPDNVQPGGIEFDGGSAPLTEVIQDDDSQTGQQSASLDYDSMGDWESAAAAYTGGFVGLGDRTPASALPKTGTAAFEGTTKGELTETASGAPEAFVVEGNVMLTANFASGLVNADFTGMEKIDSSGVTSAWVDFRARMSIADGTSEFAGTAGTDDGVWNGKARGGFFGDEGGMPGHAAGMWSMSSPLGQAIGGFMAKRR